MEESSNGANTAVVSFPPPPPDLCRYSSSMYQYAASTPNNTNTISTTTATAKSDAKQQQAVTPANDTDTAIDDDLLNDANDHSLLAQRKPTNSYESSESTSMVSDRVDGLSPSSASSTSFSPVSSPLNSFVQDEKRLKVEEANNETASTSSRSSPLKTVILPGQELAEQEPCYNEEHNNQNDTEEEDDDEEEEDNDEEEEEEEETSLMSRSVTSSRASTPHSHFSGKNLATANATDAPPAASVVVMSQEEEEEEEEASSANQTSWVLYICFFKNKDFKRPKDVLR